MLKKILSGLAALVVLLLIVVAVQPSDFRVERTTTVAAPAANVFAQVNDLHKWDAWSPWAKLDPNVKISFEGPEAGQGAAISWAGNDKVGEGKMILTESRPNELVKTRVDMVKPFEVSSTSEFTFKPEGDQTSITWSVATHHNFMQKALCLIMGGKKMMGGLMEKCLAQMKSVVESKSSG